MKTSPTLSYRSALMTLSLGLLVGAGCLSDDSPGELPTVDCGDGDPVAFDGETFCVYDDALIIEGFLCPEAVPHEFDADGAVVCGPSTTEPSGGVDAVVQVWQQGMTDPDTSDDTASDVTDDVSDASGEDTVADTSGPTLTACESNLMQAAGDAVAIAGKTGCVVDTVCGEGLGLNVACDDGNSWCRCSQGDVRCVAWSAGSCGALNSDVGGPCEQSLGEGVCAEGAYCFEDIQPYPGECRALDPLCAPGGCYTHGDCADGRCEGGSRTTGTLGRCYAAHDVTTCYGPGGCPEGWTCEGAAGCAACTDCPDDAPGQCVSDGIEDLSLFAPAGVYASQAPIPIGWALGDDAPKEVYFTCPTFALEVRNELNGEWQRLSDEDCSETFVVLYPGQLLSREAVSFIPDPELGYRWGRVVGTYYTDCSPTTGITSCQNGPTEVTSAPFLVEAGP